jgi:hypothetical protein
MVLTASLGCVYLSYSLSRELILLSWFFTILNAVPLLLNRAGLFPLSRYLLSVSPSIYLAVLHLSIKPVDEKVSVALLLIQLAMLTVPWMMFKFTEKAGLATVLVINFILIGASVYMQGFNSGEFNDNIYDRGIGFDFGLLVAAFSVTLIVGLSSYLHHKAAKQSKQLLKSVQKKNQKLEEGQEQLQEYIRQVEEAQKIEKKRQWIADQINRLSDVIRSNTSISSTYDELISTIVKGLKANQAGLYVLEEDEGEEYLELKACYAYGKKKYKEQHLEIGQSLVGQCFLEREPIYMTEVPDGYTYITSGLGYATPDAILIVPLKFEDRVEGVLEIAAFDTFDKFQQEYLNQVSKALGNFLYNQRILKRNAVPA